MRHLTTATLCLKLHSPNIMDRAFAAEELGRRGATETVGALCDLLLAITAEHARAMDAAPFIIDALAELGDARAARPIFEVLRRTAGTFLLPELEPLSAVACRALLRLRATSMLPALRELQEGRSGFLYRDLVSRTIAKLGGEAEAPFFASLLDSPSGVVRAAACSALGILGHAPAGPRLEQLARSEERNVRWAALGACVAMGRPGALAALAHEAQLLGDLEQKLSLLYMTLDQQLAPAASLLCDLSRDPRWASCPSTFFYTLEAAVQLGSSDARDQLRAIERDAQASPCARARAAGILLAHTGDVEMVAPCFRFLRQCGEPGKRDPRDDRSRRSATQLDVIEGLERFGRAYPEHRGRLADGLCEILWREESMMNGEDEAAADPAADPGAAPDGVVVAAIDADTEDELHRQLHRELRSERAREHELDAISLVSVPDRAGHALYSLTGVSSGPELERWKRADARLN